MPPQGLKRLHDGRSIVYIDPATLKPEELEVLNSLDTIWTHPNGLEKLRPLKWIFDSLRDASEPSESNTTVYRTPYDRLIAARDLEEIDYHPNDVQYMWQLSEDEELSNGKLSWWADQCITGIMQSENFFYSWAIRPVLDVILCDRLARLARHDDCNSDRKLNWYPKKSAYDLVDILGTTTQGKINWSPSHGEIDAEEVDVTLILFVAEKLMSNPQTLMPELIIYLSTIQGKSERAGENHHSVFGVLFDSITFIFAHLDPQRKLYVSKPYSLNSESEKVQIIQWIDKILAEALHAAPR